MTTFFTSDLHHSHKNITQYTSRHLDTSPEEHNSWLTQTWNNQVQHEDTVWHIGDFSFASKYIDIVDFIKGLNGRIYLIKGNHDDEKVLSKLKVDGWILDWFNYKEIKINQVRTCLFHFPIACWHQQGRGSFHLYGHSHGNFSSDGKSLDVGIDSAYNHKGKHCLFSENDIEIYMSTKEVQVKDHHKDTTRGDSTK